VKCFLAPFPRDCVKDDCKPADANKETWEWQFLSRKCAAVVALLCDNHPARVTSLAAYGLKWQVEEAVVECALLGQYTEESLFSLDKWEWLDDPGCNTRVTRDHKLAVIPPIKTLTSQSFFPGGGLSC